MKGKYPMEEKVVYMFRKPLYGYIRGFAVRQDNDERYKFRKYILSKIINDNDVETRNPNNDILLDIWNMIPPLRIICNKTARWLVPYKTNKMERTIYQEFMGDLYNLPLGIFGFKKESQRPLWIRH